jgi:hypothetical protein
MNQTTVTVDCSALLDVLLEVLLWSTELVYAHVVTTTASGEQLTVLHSVCVCTVFSAAYMCCVMRSA